MSGALHIERLVKEYKPGAPVLKSIDLAIEGTGLTSIIGPSGTGKSTLIRCINRLVAPTSGRILLDLPGERVNMAQLQGRALRRARRHIGMVFQEYNLVERLSVMENVLTGRLGYLSAWRAWRRQFDPEDVERAYALLDTVGLAAFSFFLKIGHNDSHLSLPVSPPSGVPFSGLTRSFLSHTIRV